MPILGALAAVVLLNHLALVLQHQFDLFGRVVWPVLSHRAPHVSSEPVSFVASLCFAGARTNRLDHINNVGALPWVEALCGTENNHVTQNSNIRFLGRALLKKNFQSRSLIHNYRECQSLQFLTNFHSTVHQVNSLANLV